MVGLYKLAKLASSVVLAGYFASIVACSGQEQTNTQALQSPTPSPASAPTLEATASAPDPIKKTLDEKILSELWPKLTKVELTYSGLFNTISKGYGYSVTYPPIFEDEASATVYEKLDSFLIDNGLIILVGLTKDYIIQPSLDEDSIPIPVKNDIQAYDDLLHDVRSDLNSLRERYHGRQIPYEVFSNRVRVSANKHVPKNTSDNRRIMLSIILIWDLEVEFNIKKNISGNLL